MIMDLNLNEEMVVLGSVKSDVGFTHDNVEVTLTDTMKQGSLLKADGTEVAAAAANNDIVGVIDDLYLRRHREEMAAGDKVMVAVAKRGLIFNSLAVKYADGNAIDAAGQAVLSGAMNKFATPSVETL